MTFEEAIVIMLKLQTCPLCKEDTFVIHHIDTSMKIYCLCGLSMICEKNDCGCEKEI